MNHTKPRYALITAGMILVIAVIGLWSWNTLAVLFDAPEAELRHALAFLALLTIFRFVAVPRNRERRICAVRGPTE